MLLYSATILLTSFVINQGRIGLRPARVWFLEIAFVREVSMRVCLCVSTPRAIKNYSREIKSE